MLVDGLEVAPLVDALGRDLPLAGRAGRAAQEVVGQLDAVVLRDELRRRLARHPWPACSRRASARRAGRAPARRARRRPASPSTMSSWPLVRMRTLNCDLEVLEVLVVGAEQRFDVLVRDGDLAHDGGGRYGVTPGQARRSGRVRTAAAPASRRGAGSAIPSMRMCNSFSCFGLTVEGAPGHQVHRLRRLGERDDVPDRLLAAQDGDDAVEPERDAAMRRRPVLERVEEEAEAQPGLLVRDLQQLEDQALQRLVVDPDAAAGDLAAVQHEVVGARPRAARDRVSSSAGVALERRGERMVHELPALLVLDPLEHREVDHPEELELRRIEQVLLLRDLQPQLRRAAATSGRACPAAIKQRDPPAPPRRARAPAGSPLRPPP